MGVRVNQSSSGDGAVTLFSDTFNRAGGELVPSQDWVVSTWSYGGTGTNRFTEAIIGATGGIQGLITNNNGINNPTVGSTIFILPTALFAGVWGQNQSAKITCVEEPTAVGYAGLFVCANPPNVRGTPSYYQLFLTNGTYGVDRWSNSVNANLLAATPRAALPLTFEFRAVIGVASVTLTVLINDVTVTTIVDSAATRVTTGIPAIYGEEIMSSGVASRHGFSNFTGKKL